MDDEHSIKRARAYIGDGWMDRYLVGRQKQIKPKYVPKSFSRCVQVRNWDRSPKSFSAAWTWRCKSWALQAADRLFWAEPRG
jgi:hypothetical protein